jgi:hypothetical protein
MDSNDPENPDADSTEPAKYDYCKLPDAERLELERILCHDLDPRYKAALLKLSERFDPDSKDRNRSAHDCKNQTKENQPQELATDQVSNDAHLVEETAQDYDERVVILKGLTQLVAERSRKQFYAAARKLGRAAICAVLLKKLDFLCKTEDCSDFNIERLAEVFLPSEPDITLIDSILTRIDIRCFLIGWSATVVTSLAVQEKEYLGGMLIDVKELCDACDAFSSLIRDAQTIDDLVFKTVWLSRRAELERALHYKKGKLFQQRPEMTWILAIDPASMKYIEVFDKAARRIRKVANPYRFNCATLKGIGLGAKSTRTAESLNPIQLSKNAQPKNASESLMEGHSTQNERSPNNSHTKSENRFCRPSSRGWEVRFQGQSASMTHLDGFFYIAKLLQSPQMELSVTDLYKQFHNAETKDVASQSRQEIVDNAALKAYHERLIAIDAELDAAERAGDEIERQELQGEKLKLKEQIRTASPLFGRLRPMKTDTESIRTAVAAAISRALDRIHENLPELWKHLDKHIDSPTGSKPIYLPPPNFPEWHVQL